MIYIPEYNFKFWMWAILDQSSPVSLLHLCNKMGHFSIDSVCREVRAEISSGNVVKLGQFHMSSRWRDVRLQIHSGIVIKLGQSIISSDFREVTCWRPTGRDTFEKLRNPRVLRLFSSCHSISSPSKSLLYSDSSERTTTVRYIKMIDRSEVPQQFLWQRFHRSNQSECL